MQFFLKTYDIAVLLDLSPDDVNAMARKGLIKGHKIGKQWRFRNRDVKKFLDHKRNQTMSQGDLKTQNLFFIVNEVEATLTIVDG